MARKIITLKLSETEIKEVLACIDHFRLGNLVYGKPIKCRAETLSRKINKQKESQYGEKKD